MRARPSSRSAEAARTMVKLCIRDGYTAMRAEGERGRAGVRGQKNGSRDHRGPQGGNVGTKKGVKHAPEGPV